MFIAINESGESISLLQPHPAEALKGCFRCDVCKEPVVLKKGTRKKWHFAHRADSKCRTGGKTESDLHMTGKKLLFQWVNQSYETEMEKFIPLINRKADVLVTINKQKYALEFQCAAITEKEILKRTQDYLSCGIRPIWIFCTKNIRVRETGKLSIHAFEWTALRESPDRRSRFLVYLDPYAETLSMFSPSLHQLKKQHLTDISIWNSSINNIIQGVQSGEKTKLNSAGWLKFKEQWRFKPQPWIGKKDATFLKEHMLKKQSDVAFFPAEAGWPVFGYEYFLTPVYIWQSCILLEFLPSVFYSRGGFALEDMIGWVKQKITGKTFRVRFFPQIKQPLRTAVLNYLFLLVRFDCLSYHQPSRTFLINKLPQAAPSLVDGYNKDREYSFQLR
ncbi:competence CoiA-like predicted nuclease [Sinobaca qinghaiensis]|uniref:Competence CoiA-like predicted nuclease n=1 Tax=Sinobaca qinghaiensis TaxID=342944 RepID=A0A419V6G7_9BACL|nr:competence protein CoiA family protein [Sinobaca qinghaiensis]RKD75584.1 competence CoiA-like predicted nuclease [Sinobaca qinghaiensis]